MEQVRFRHERNRTVRFINPIMNICMKKSNGKQTETYILFSCNTWHEYSSFEPQAVFSSEDKAAEFLKKNKRKLKLEDDDIECFMQYHQTQGKGTNYLIQPCPFDPATMQET